MKIKSGIKERIKTLFLIKSRLLVRLLPRGRSLFVDLFFAVDLDAARANEL